MDILGVGFPELIFIMIIAMMVFGPRRLPEIAAKAGKIVADLRNMSQGMMAEWQREINAANELDGLKKTGQELLSIKNEIQEAKKSVASSTNIVKQVTNSIMPPELNPNNSPDQKPVAPEPDSEDTAPPAETPAPAPAPTDGQPVADSNVAADTSGEPQKSTEDTEQIVDEHNKQ